MHGSQMMYAILFMITGLLDVQVASALSCDPALVRLFTPRHPVAGHYDVCTSPEPLEALVPNAWKVELLPPLDAFGTAGSYDRSRLARVYGAQRPRVTRGSIQEDGQIISLTF